MQIYNALPVHKNLVKFIDGTFVRTQKGTQALFLMEFCGHGTIFDMMVKYEKTKLKEKTIIFT